jgi:hypothetical protein
MVVRWLLCNCGSWVSPTGISNRIAAAVDGKLVGEVVAHAFVALAG